MSVDEMRSVLRAHAERYPRWELTDRMKLLYQSEFGPGHLIADPEESLRRLRDEWERTEPDESQPLVEDIGGGFARLHLAPARAARLAVEAVHEIFLQSAEKPRRSARGFEEKAQLLVDFGQSREDIEAFLADWRARGCPPFSHSESYRAAYRPAYRVVLSGLVEPLTNKS